MLSGSCGICARTENWYNFDAIGFSFVIAENREPRFYGFWSEFLIPSTYCSCDSLFSGLSRHFFVESHQQSALFVELSQYLLLGLGDLFELLMDIEVISAGFPVKLYLIVDGAQGGLFFPRREGFYGSPWADKTIQGVRGWGFFGELVRQPLHFRIAEFILIIFIGEIMNI